MRRRKSRTSCCGRKRRDEEKEKEDGEKEKEDKEKEEEDKEKEEEDEKKDKEDEEKEKGVSKRNNIDNSNRKRSARVGGRPGEGAGRKNEQVK